MKLRYIGLDQAKQEIETLLATIQTPLDHGNIADQLQLELKLVATACNELIKEGKLSEDDE